MKRVKHLIRRLGHAYVQGMIDMYRPLFEYNVPIHF